MPKISIIIPIYNVEQYIDRCFNSILNQSCKDIEIICVNDGSTDKSLDIVNQYAQNESRFIVITQNNQGTFIARRTGLKYATGEFVYFIDPDDRIGNKTLQLAYEKATMQNSDIVYTKAKIIDTDNKEIPSCYFDTKHKILYGQDIITAMSKLEIPHNITTVLIKSELIKKAYSLLGFVNKHFIRSTDLLVFFVLCIYAQKYIVIEEDFYYQYKRSSSATLDLSIKGKVKQMQGPTIAIQSIEHFLKTNKINDKHIINALAKIKHYQFLRVKTDTFEYLTFNVYWRDYINFWLCFWTEPVSMLLKVLKIYKKIVF